MADDWFFVRNGKKIGPITAQELKRMADAGQIGPTDMVSKKGLGKWVAAASVNGLCSAAMTQSPSGRTSAQTILAEGDVTLTTHGLAVGSNEFALEDIRRATVNARRSDFQLLPWISLSLAGVMFIYSFLVALLFATPKIQEISDLPVNWPVTDVIRISKEDGSASSQLPRDSDQNRD